MRSTVVTLLELVGVAAVVTGAWLVSWFFGLIVLGLVMVAAAQIVERSTRDPEVKR